MTTQCHFRDVLAERLSRRRLLQGAGAAALTAGTGTFGTLFSSDARAAQPNLTFASLPHGLDDTHHAAKGYTARVLVRWGDKLAADAPAFEPGKLTAAGQAKQFGYNCDFVAYMPLPVGSTNSEIGILGVNNETVITRLVFSDRADSGAAGKMTAEQVGVEMESVGFSLVEIRKEGGTWRSVESSRYNRRITATTPIAIMGPAAGDKRMQTAADPGGRMAKGTYGNCAGGTTPWGTILSGEENISHMFQGDGSGTPEAANHKRMNMSNSTRYGWSRFDERFVTAKHPTEPNRWGWVVEIDPYDPGSMPVKRTALGRCRHEGATTALTADGRVAVYTGDDAVNEYIYRFVSRGRFDPANRAANRNLLDDGVLSVARFDADGTLTWLPLVHGQGPLTAANGFNSQADVVIELRRAGDLLGATPCDRPEDVEANPLTGRVYAALTKGKRAAGKTDRANPRENNDGGHILEMIPPDAGGKPDHGADKFLWDVFILAGDPEDGKFAAKYPGKLPDGGWFANPDNFAFDPKGRLWISTDGLDDFGPADGLFACTLDGPERGITRRFFAVPKGAEAAGPCFTPDGKTLFVAIQHPADEQGSTFDKPVNRWPDNDPKLPPRPSVMAITKDDGGEIG
jgi:secreted PhoX family phosphatase